MESTEGKTPAEIAAMPPVTAAEPTPAEIALEGLIPPPDAPQDVEGTLPPTDTPTTPPGASNITSGAPTEAAKEVEPRYNTQLASLMAKARESREQQVQTNQQEEQRKLIERMEMAKQLGPDAVLKAAGMERQKIDIAKLLNPEQHDEEPKSVQELKNQVAEINQYLTTLREQGEQNQQRMQQEQNVQWEQNELNTISRFIDTSKEKYEYVDAAKSIGSDKDIYNGLISMYNQGYSPSYDEMTDLVESRIEQLIDLVAPTKKFSDYMSKRYGVQLTPPSADSVTLTEGLKSEPSSGVDLAGMTDEENRKFAFEQATLAKNNALRKLGQAVG